jgi:hypothetical protein
MVPQKQKRNFSEDNVNVQQMSAQRKQSSQQQQQQYQPHRQSQYQPAKQQYSQNNQVYP